MTPSALRLLLALQQGLDERPEGRTKVEFQGLLRRGPLIGIVLITERDGRVTDDVGDGLLRFLRRKFETVSWERVLSGPGLADLYRYLLQVDGREEPDWFAAAQAEGDPVPAISEAAAEERCPTSVRTLEVFAGLYGEEAGNLALKLMATGGVWVGGGIAPKILSFLTGGAWMAGFLSKGRMKPLLESMPVRIILNDRCALLGAALRAAHSLDS